jgi:subtilase family serine protease
MKTKTANLQQKFLWVCGLLAACSMIVPTAGAQLAAPRIGAEINSAEQSTLKNSLHPLAQAQFDAGRMAADARLNGISILFNRTAAQEANLQALIAAQQNPSSPLYHQWLTPDQFAAQFGMSDADLSKVESWLEQQGFSIDSVARSKNGIHFSGTVRQVEQAFSTQMHNYKVNGSEHFAPSTALSVPAALASTILIVQNLDNFRPSARVVFRKNMRARANFTGAGSTNAQNETIFFAPGDIKTAYDITPLSSASVTGAGQSITIVGQSAVQQSDLTNFQNAAGLSPNSPTLYLVPNTGASTVEAEGDEAESDLDLEWSDAIAPGATINFVYVGSNQNYSAFDSIQYAIDQKIGTIISSSYGECEAYLPQTTLGDGTTLVEPALETAFEQATTQGQTVMAAAGDDGSTDCNEYGGPGTSPPLNATDTTLAVDYPASSPYVTGMGGTEISQTNAAYYTVGQGYWEADSGTSDIVNSVQQYIPEIVWNDDVLSVANGGGLSASGGGASALFAQPSWQTGVPGIPTASGGPRYVPDLALYGSPNWPGYVFCSSDTTAWSSGQESSCTSGFDDSASGLQTAAGGTSFDGPIFSGMLALINQKQGYTTGQGLINPTLYTLASNSTTYQSAFHAILAGNNDCTAGSTWCGSQTGGFSVSGSYGYSEVSGLGSVDASVLAGAWPANSSTAPPLIATTTTITASNTAPNVNASDTFTVTVTAASGTPTGSITLTVDTNAPVTETLSSNGTFVYPYTFTTAGSHTILAAYVADSTYAASTGSVTVNVATVSSGKGTISLAATPSTLTVPQGSSGNETVTVTPAGGYTGTVDLSFDTSNDTALQNLCYNWTNINTAGDGTVAITSATTPVTTTLSLDANASDCASTAAIQKSGKHAFKMLHPRTPAQTTARDSGRNPLPLTVAFAGLLLVGFMGRSSRKLRGLAALLLLAAVGLAVSACGGVTTTADSNPPTGTYTITVSGQDSAGSITATPVTFTLVISGS